MTVQFIDFSSWFQALWSREPFPWQRMLARRLVEGDWPRALDLPTAAGKTACIDVAVYALASQAGRPVWERTAPRRIWFVVDRRIVVDEAFDRARNIARRLQEATKGPLKEVADRLRALGGTDRPLAVARLRGGILRDDGWARLPSQPAVITSTVDQLGSRLLFRGYGGSTLTAPIYAGLAAHDSLVLLDEAHLSTAFMQTLHAVERYRGPDWAEQPIRTPFAFAMLSATLAAGVGEDDTFPGKERPRALDHPELRRRMGAAKPVLLEQVKVGKRADQDPLVEVAARHAAEFIGGESRQRVAVILNRVRTAEAVARHLREKLGETMDVVLLTGRLRPLERDDLVARWKPVLRANRPEMPRRPVILVTTQCIEVGADFSFDALVTEIASLDALRQRFGRLNRLGALESAPGVILARDCDVRPGTEDFVYGTALTETWQLLDGLATVEGQGGAQRKVIDFGIEALDAQLRRAGDLTPCLAPAPDAPLLLPSHLDLLCQTAPRPAVEPDIQMYLHGVDRGRAEVGVVWRADLDPDAPDSWAETVALCPPNAGETVSVPLHRLRRWLARSGPGEDTADLEGVPEHDGHEEGGSVRPALLWRGRERSRVCRSATELRPDDVIVVPAAYGMEGVGQSAPNRVLGPQRLDIWEPSRAQSGKPPALRLHRPLLEPWLSYQPLRELLELAEQPAPDPDRLQEAVDAVLAHRPENEDDAAPPAWWCEVLKESRDGRREPHPAGGLILYATGRTDPVQEEPDLFADDDDLLSATGQAVPVDVHSASVKRAVAKLASLCLPEEVRPPLEDAAWWHDVGKADERFQIMLHQGDELAAVSGAPLAKSAAVPESPTQRRAVRAASGLPQDFRHEMLSLQLAERFLPETDGTTARDLALHCIASHHGFGRPFAPVCPDPKPPAVRLGHGGVEVEVDARERAGWPPPHALGSGVAERFWRLNRRFGWWGLAYLEAILRLGDWYGSRWIVDEVPEEKTRGVGGPRHDSVRHEGGALVLYGIDGANPLGFLTAAGVLVVLHRAGHREVRLAWQRDGIIWRPRLSGLPTSEPKALAKLLVGYLGGAAVPGEASERCKRLEKQYSQKKKELKDRRDAIKKRKLRGAEREAALLAEVEPLEHETEALRAQWLEALRQAAPRPELALGRNIDCAEQEYRAIVDPLLKAANHDDRDSLDLLAAFCASGCLHDSPDKRKAGKLAATPFAFISGSGHQDFLDTARALLTRVSAERVMSVLFESWNYSDDGLSMRWDPVEDRRYALMDRDPTATGNKPRTVWMANLLAYRALALFPSAPQRRGLATAGWSRQGDDLVFTWPLWHPGIGPDTLRSLLLLPDLCASRPDRTRLHELGVESVLRVRRIKVGSGSNYKVNFSQAREV